VFDRYRRVVDAKWGKNPRLDRRRARQGRVTSRTYGGSQGVDLCGGRAEKGGNGEGCLWSRWTLQTGKRSLARDTEGGQEYPPRNPFGPWGVQATKYEKVGREKERKGVLGRKQS